MFRAPQSGHSLLRGTTFLTVRDKISTSRAQYFAGPEYMSMAAARYQEFTRRISFGGITFLMSSLKFELWELIRHHRDGNGIIDGYWHGHTVRAQRHESLHSPPLMVVDAERGLSTKSVNLHRLRATQWRIETLQLERTHDVRRQVC